MQPARPSSRFSHLPRVFGRAALFLLPIAITISFFAYRFTHYNATNQFPTSTVTNSVNTLDLLDIAPSLARRPVFPFSIVPGGVRDKQELQSAAAADPIVAKHYSDFRISNAHPVHLDHPVPMYVSYRRNNQVFWTRHQMLIPAGETLLSDGENFVRVRCGNRLSAIAVKPVSISEPTKEELSTPEFPPLLAELVPAEGFEQFPGPVGNIPALPLLLPRGPNTTSSSSAPPFAPPLLPPGNTANTPHDPETPPVSTPEPSSMLLLLLGAVFVTLLAAFSLRRN